MPKRRYGIWVDRKFYDWDHLPPWYEDIRPSLGTYDSDGNLHIYPETLTESERNEISNSRGAARVGAVIVFIGVLWLATFVALVGIIVAR